MPESNSSLSKGESGGGAIGFISSLVFCCSFEILNHIFDINFLEKN